MDGGGSDQNHPKEEKCKKVKWLSEETLQLAEKRESKGKGEKESYIHMNAEFQRIAKRDKKAFSVINAKKQRKTIQWERLETLEENQTYQGNISCKYNTIKDRNDMDLTEAEDIKKRQKEHTEELQMEVCDITGSTDKDDPQEKEMQKGKMVVSGGLTNS